jgi:acyl dehydratase
LNLDMVGQKIVDTELVVDPERLRQLSGAIATGSASQTALLVPFFAATAAGQDSVIGPLGLDLSRGLQGGQAFEWHRPFRVGETVRLNVVVADLYEKNATQFATVLAEFRATDGELIQRQRTMFIERGEA